MEDSKRLESLKAKLASRNIASVAETISHLRNEKQFYGAVSLLCELYDKTDDHELMSMISSFLNDMKDNAVKSEIIEELEKPYKSETLAMILSSCWQSGLDYSEYSIQFAMLFLKGSYAVALESYTLLEESAMNISPSLKLEIRDILISSREALKREKMPLLEDLIKLYS